MSAGVETGHTQITGVPLCTHSIVCSCEGHQMSALCKCVCSLGVVVVVVIVVVGSSSGIGCHLVAMATLVIVHILGLSPVALQRSRKDIKVHAYFPPQTPQRAPQPPRRQVVCQCCVLL